MPASAPAGATSTNGTRARSRQARRVEPPLAGRTTTAASSRPAASAACSGPLTSSVSWMVSPGWRCVSRRSACGSTEVCTLVIAPTRSRPLTDSVDRARKPSITASALPAAAASSRANGVGTAVRPERSNSGRPK